MSDYRSIFDPFIKKVEGEAQDTYVDTKGNHTIGTGLNLNDETVQGLMNLRGIDPEQVRTGERKLANEELDDIHNQYVGKREGLVRDKVGKDLYDMLKPHEKAAVMSMGYQSLNNLGPILTGRIATDDKIGAMREMILNTNKDQDPGILRRRLEEAELYGGPLDFTATFKTMSSDEKKQLRDMMDKLQNQNVKQEMTNKYGSYLQDEQTTPFKKLQDSLNVKVGSNNQD